MRRRPGDRQGLASSVGTPLAEIPVLFDRLGGAQKLEADRLPTMAAVGKLLAFDQGSFVMGAVLLVNDEVNAGMGNGAPWPVEVLRHDRAGDAPKRLL
jgi:hypothetical protein